MTPSFKIVDAELLTINPTNLLHDLPRSIFLGPKMKASVIFLGPLKANVGYLINCVVSSNGRHIHQLSYLEYVRSNALFPPYPRRLSPERQVIGADTGEHHTSVRLVGRLKLKKTSCVIQW